MMSGESTVELIFGPASLGEFLSKEIAGAEEGVEIHRENLDQIKQGDKELEKVYGSTEGASRLVEYSEKRLRDYKQAQGSLEKGEKQPALRLLEEEIEELNRVINDNFQRGNIAAVSHFIKDLNVLRMLLEDQKGK